MTNNKMLRTIKRKINVRTLLIFTTIYLLIGMLFFLWQIQNKLFFFSAVGIDFMMLLRGLFLEKLGKEEYKNKNKNKEQKLKITLHFLERMQTLLIIICMINIGIMMLFLILTYIKGG